MSKACWAVNAVRVILNSQADPQLERVQPSTGVPKRGAKCTLRTHHIFLNLGTIEDNFVWIRLLKNARRCGIVVETSEPLSRSEQGEDVAH